MPKFYETIQSILNKDKLNETFSFVTNIRSSIGSLTIQMITQRFLTRTILQALDWLRWTLAPVHYHVSGFLVEYTMNIEVHKIMLNVMRSKREDIESMTSTALL